MESHLSGWGTVAMRRGFWTLSLLVQVAHPLTCKLPVLSPPAELNQCEQSGSPPTCTLWKTTVLTCFQAPSRIQESLAFDDLVFQGFNLLYFEIEIPEPARDPALTADVLNFLWLRKSISLLYFLQCMTCQAAGIEAEFVKPRAACSPPAPVSGIG